MNSSKRLLTRGANPLRDIYKDFCDDGDGGAGAVLLESMKQSDLTHKAIYVVRYCGASKLGEKRLDAYMQAAKVLIATKPKNTILGKEQVLDWEARRKRQEKTNTQANSATKNTQPNHNAWSKGPPRPYAANAGGSNQIKTHQFRASQGRGSHSSRGRENSRKRDESVD